MISRASFQKLEQIDQLIRLKSAGTSNAFAQKLGISRATLFNYIGFLKELGGPIIYNRTAKTYEYEYPVMLNLGYCRKSMLGVEQVEVQIDFKNHSPPLPTRRKCLDRNTSFFPIGHFGH